MGCRDPIVEPLPGAYVDYISQAASAEVAGIARPLLVVKVRLDQFIDPDVRIGVLIKRPAVGYLPDRVKRWREYVGYADVEPGKRVRMPHPPHPDWWYADTRVLLAREDLAQLYDMTVMAIDKRSGVGKLPIVADRIITERWTIRGWSLRAALRFASDEGISINQSVAAELAAYA